MAGSAGTRVASPGRSSSDTESAALLRTAGLPPDVDRITPVAEYLQRTGRARRWGLAAGLLGGGRVAHFGDDSPYLGLAVLLIGYLLGVLVGELLAPRRPRGTVRRATLRPRATTALLPTWARWTPWVALLVPALGSPLLLLGSHPQGSTSYRDLQGTCHALSSWPAARGLWAVTGAALIGLMVYELTVSRLVHRRYAIEDGAAASVDLLLRGMSARAIAGSSTALGLALISGTVFAIGPSLHSYRCVTSVHDIALVYPFGPTLDGWLQTGAFVAFGLCLVIWAISRRRVDPRRRRGDAPWL